MAVEQQGIGGGQRRAASATLRRRAGFFAIVFGCAWRALFDGTRVLLILALMFLAVYGSVLATFKYVDPPASSLMLQRRLAGEPIDQRWVPLDRISRHLVHAVVMSEDARFCEHGGIDFRELEEAFEKAAERGDGAVRGASTISMQLVKNLFLWSGKHLSRKGLEMALTPGMEMVWTKRRILEVYLNIAEWGPGIFGAEAAADYHFGKPASRLTAREAALLAVTLPNPIERIASEPGPGLRRLADTIQTRMKSAPRHTRCVER